MKTTNIHLTSYQSVAQQLTEIRVFETEDGAMAGKIDLGRSYGIGHTPAYRQEMTADEADMLAKMLMDAAQAARHGWRFPEDNATVRRAAGRSR